MHTGVSRRKPKGYEKSAIRDGRSKPVTDKEKAKNIGLYNGSFVCCGTVKNSL